MLVINENHAPLAISTYIAKEIAKAESYFYSSALLAEWYLKRLINTLFDCMEDTNIACSIRCYCQNLLYKPERALLQLYQLQGLSLKYMKQVSQEIQQRCFRLIR